AERAQASLALHLAGGETVLFDTSSGTVLLQRLRAAGIALDSIRHVFVSHRHFDHAGGLAPLLVTLVPIAGAHLTVYAPPETLVEYAAGADLLIHETYGLQNAAAEAHRFGHATAADAGVAARAAGVRHLVLTHLRSSLYTDPWALRDEAARAFDGPVTVAADL